MKFSTIGTLALTSAALSSCVYYTDPVPEMPYRPYKPNPEVQLANEQALAAAAQAEGTWYTTPPADAYGSYMNAAIPTPAAAAAPLPAPTAAAPQNTLALNTPQPTPATGAPAATTPAPASPSTAITQAPLTLNPVTPKPAATVSTAPAAAPKPAASATKPATTTSATKDMKDITNNGPIPVATPVPGDPTRVYNPLDPSKTIQIVDDKGHVYPSGKKLKVRGTNFHFYVP